MVGGFPYLRLPWNLETWKSLQGNLFMKSGNSFTKNSQKNVEKAQNSGKCHGFLGGVIGCDRDMRKIANSDQSFRDTVFLSEKLIIVFFKLKMC